MRARFIHLINMGPSENSESVAIIAGVTCAIRLLPSATSGVTTVGLIRAISGTR